MNKNKTLDKFKHDEIRFIFSLCKEETLNSAKGYYQDEYEQLFNELRLTNDNEVFITNTIKRTSKHNISNEKIAAINYLDQVELLNNINLDLQSYNDIYEKKCSITISLICVIFFFLLMMALLVCFLSIGSNFI